MKCQVSLCLYAIRKCGVLLLLKHEILEKLFKIEIIFK